MSEGASADLREIWFRIEATNFMAALRGGVVLWYPILWRSPCPTPTAKKWRLKGVIGSNPGRDRRFVAQA
jgi:hypothetical protein